MLNQETWNCSTRDHLPPKQILMTSVQKSLSTYAKWSKYTFGKQQYLWLVYKSHWIHMPCDQSTKFGNYKRRPPYLWRECELDQQAVQSYPQGKTTHLETWSLGASATDSKSYCCTIGSFPSSSDKFKFQMFPYLPVIQPSLRKRPKSKWSEVPTSLALQTELFK